ncbi:MAG: hypothetical protein M3O36_00890 [Myxococcota bacterium]|nr:hypothetical protein [Myxococcota bacterium]
MRSSAAGLVGIVTLVGALAPVVGCRRGPPQADVAAGDAGPPSDGASGAASAEPANGLPIPVGSVASVVNPMNLPAYDGPTGSVEGTVLVRGPDAPATPGLSVSSCPAALDTYGKLFRSGLPRGDGARPLADAIVVVTGYSGYYLPEKNPVLRVTIGADCAYPSLTLALTFGQRLDVANDSSLPFAPYLEGTLLPAVMIAPPMQSGEPVKIYPPRADYFALRDRMESFVRGDVYVLRHPLHAVSDLRGHFRIGGVPVGKLKVGARHRAVGKEDLKEIEVRPNVVENVELVLDYVPPQQAAPDDGGGPKRPYLN